MFKPPSIMLAQPSVIPSTQPSDSSSVEPSSQPSTSISAQPSASPSPQTSPIPSAQSTMSTASSPQSTTVTSVVPPQTSPTVKPTTTKPPLPRTGRVLQFSDFHYDRDYSAHGIPIPSMLCHNNDSLEGSYPTPGPFGEYACDANKVIPTLPPPDLMTSYFLFDTPCSGSLQIEQISRNETYDDSDRTVTKTAFYRLS